MKNAIVIYNPKRLQWKQEAADYLYLLPEPLCPEYMMIQYYRETDTSDYKFSDILFASPTDPKPKLRPVPFKSASNMTLITNMKKT